MLYIESWKWGNKSIPLGGAYLLYRWTRSTISFGGCDRYGCSVCACLYVLCSVHISEGGVSHPMSFRLTRRVCLLDCRSVSSRTLMSSSSSLLHAAALNISNRLGCDVIQPERPFLLRRIYGHTDHAPGGVVAHCIYREDSPSSLRMFTSHVKSLGCAE
jgi:hypothetical protein